MTVRLVPSESDSSPTPPVAAPPQPSELPVTTPGSDPVVADPVGAVLVAGAPGEPAEPVVPQSVTPDSRVAVREARRARRRTAWLCAAVVAVALALTIVVVSLARTRPIPQASAPLVALATAAPVLVPSAMTPGAPAPEGGTP
jgi:hypothetical protein